MLNSQSLGHFRSQSRPLQSWTSIRSMWECSAGWFWDVDSLHHLETSTTHAKNTINQYHHFRYSRTSNCLAPTKNRYVSMILCWFTMEIVISIRSYIPSTSHSFDNGERGRQRLRLSPKAEEKVAKVRNRWMGGPSHHRFGKWWMNFRWFGVILLFLETQIIELLRMRVVEYRSKQREFCQKQQY